MMTNAAPVDTMIAEAFHHMPIRFVYSLTPAANHMCQYEPGSGT